MGLVISEMESSSSSNGSSRGVVVVVADKQGMRMENPFSFKVGQVFTGFGFGCGLGIGVGRPLNLGAIPVLNQVMAATGGASDALSGVARHVNQSLRKLGVKNLEAGIGCGVGFGHGFGVGLAIKPGVVHQIQTFAVQTVTKMMMRFGVTPDLSSAQGLIPASLQSGMTKVENPTNQNQIGNIIQLATKVTGRTGQDGNLSTGLAVEVETSASKNPPAITSYESRTEKVLNSFLKSPLLKDEDRKSSDLADGLQSENNMLHMVLKHQVVIEELREENERLRQILVEDLKIPASKLKATNSSIRNPSPCTDCFECRRKQRKR